MEVQFWLKSQTKDTTSLIAPRDRLLGSAYVNFSSLTKTSSFKGVVRYRISLLQSVKRVEP